MAYFTPGRKQIEIATVCERGRKVCQINEQKDIGLS